MRHLLLLSLAATLAACGTPDPGDDDTDVDTDGADTDDGVDTEVADSDDVVDSDADTDDSDVDTDPDGDADADGSPNGVDCDDDDPAVYPGAPELCDGVDQDCAGGDEEGLATFFPLTGAPVDLTAGLAAGGPTSLVGSGTVRLCGGSWPGTMSTEVATEVTVIGQAGHATPVLTNGITFRGDGTVQGVDLDTADVRGGNQASLVIEDADISGGTIWIDGVGALELRRVTAHDQAGVYWVAVLNVGTNPASDVLVEDSTFDTMNNPFAGDLHLTVRDSAFTGTSGLGSVSALLMEDTTFESGGFNVDGTGTETAVLRRVTAAATQTSWNLTDLASATLEDVELTNRGVYNGLRVADVGTVDLTRVTFTFDTTNAVYAALSLDGNGQTEMVAEVTDCTFTGGDTASHIDATGPVALTVLRGTFEGAGDSAIEAQSTHDLVVRDSTFADCDAGTTTGGVQFNGGGGAIYANLTDRAVTIDGCGFTDDTATTYGGDVYVRGADLTITDSVFAGGRAAQGGSIYLTDGDATLTDVTVTDVVTSSGTAAVLVTTPATAVVTRGHYLRNSTTASHGGAFATWGRTTFVSVDLGSGVDDNLPDDIGFPDVDAGGYGGASYTTFTGVCESESGCL